MMDYRKKDGVFNDAENVGDIVHLYGGDCHSVMEEIWHLGVYSANVR